MLCLGATVGAAASLHLPQMVQVHGDHLNLTSNTSNRLLLAVKYWIPRLGLEAKYYYYKYFENENHV